MGEHQHLFHWQGPEPLPRTAPPAACCICGVTYGTIQRTNYCPLCEANTRRAEHAEAEVVRLRGLMLHVWRTHDPRTGVEECGCGDCVAFTAALGEEHTE